MSILLHKELMSKLQENREATERELMQNLQDCLDDINACGFVLTCDMDNDEKLDNSATHFTLRTEKEFAEDC